MMRGAWMAVGAGFCFATMGALIRVASAELDNAMIVFLRNIFGLLLLTPWLIRLRWHGLRTQRLGLHFTRTLFGLSAMYCFFYAIPRLHLAEAVLLNYSAPLFIPIMAWFYLKERHRPAVYMAILIGFGGVALLMKPGSAMLSMAGLIGLCSGVLAAVAMVSIRRMSDTEPSARIVFYFTIFSVLISILPALWDATMPTSHAILIMLVAGGFATAGQLLLTGAYARAPAARVASLVYSTVLFAGLYGWIFWGETHGLESLLGTVLIVGAGVAAATLGVRRSAVEADAPLPPVRQQGSS